MRLENDKQVADKRLIIELDCDLVKHETNPPLDRGSPSIGSTLLRLGIQTAIGGVRHTQMPRQCCLFCVDRTIIAQ
jgi:hypothetical protein